MTSTGKKPSWWKRPRTRKQYDDLHSQSLVFVGVTAVIVALALPLLDSSASVWTRVGVTLALTGTVLNGIGFMMVGKWALDEAVEPNDPAVSLYRWQMGFVAVSVFIIGLSLALMLVGQWNRHL